MAATAQSITDICRAARVAGRELAQLDTSVKDAALEAIAAAIDARSEEILEANLRDREAGHAADLNPAFLDKLRLDAPRVAAISAGVRAIVALPDPVGEVIERFEMSEGLRVRKVRVPIGVVAVVYEARPNVTIDAAALALKAGNAIVLRGSSAASHSNAVLAGIATEAAVGAGLPAGAIGLVAGGGHEELGDLATQNDLVDLIIPRGGEGLKNALKDVATVPVIYAASGNCHVYVDAGADLDTAQAIAINAKTQRPGVCNAMETLLVHRAVAAEFLPRVLPALREAGVELRVDGRTRAAAGDLADTLAEVTEEDWDTEFAAMILAVGVVDSVQDAIRHINEHGSGHSEAIVTPSAENGAAFQLGVDAACVYVNASTRFTDGFEYGMGAEIGNSTQKLHARGPIGMRELTTYKYLVDGTGQVRP